MNIIAHRGCWKIKREQNTIRAFERAIRLGFGIETDIRDRSGKLVIAHDCPDVKSLAGERAFQTFSKMGPHQVLAINIKSDGLQKLLGQYLKRFKIKNYFIFDASIPDTLGYSSLKMKYFARHSEYEPLSDLTKKASGVWLDSFHKDRFNEKFISRFLCSKKKVCVVSPELHHRPYTKIWKMLRSEKLRKHGQELMVCTDLPERAKEYFCC